MYEGVGYSVPTVFLNRARPEHAETTFADGAVD